VGGPQQSNSLRRGSGPCHWITTPWRMVLNIMSGNGQIYKKRLALSVFQIFRAEHKPWRLAWRRRLLLHFGRDEWGWLLWMVNGPLVLLFITLGFAHRRLSLRSCVARNFSSRKIKKIGFLTRRP